MSYIDTAVQQASNRADQAINIANSVISGLSTAGVAAQLMVHESTPGTNGAGSLGEASGEVKPLEFKTLPDIPWDKLVGGGKKFGTAEFEKGAEGIRNLLKALSDSVKQIDAARAKEEALVKNPASFGIGSFATDARISEADKAAVEEAARTGQAAEKTAVSEYLEKQKAMESLAHEADQYLSELAALEIAAEQAVVAKTTNANLERDAEFAAAQCAAYDAVNDKKSLLQKTMRDLQAAKVGAWAARQNWFSHKTSTSNGVKAVRFGSLGLEGVDGTMPGDEEAPYMNSGPINFSGIRAVRAPGGLAVQPEYRFYKVGEDSVDPYHIDKYEHIGVPKIDPEVFESYFDWTKTPLPELPLIDFAIADDIRAFEYVELADNNLDSLKSWVSEIAEFGSAVATGWAQSSFEQARDKEAGVYIKLLEGLQDEFASRGFRVPQPASLKLAVAGAEKYAAAVGDVIRMVSIKAMEMDVELRKFATDKAISIEQLVSEISKAVADRALKAAEVTVNLQVVAINAKLEIQKVALEVYIQEEKLQRGRLEANLSRVELFKMQLTSAEIAVKDRAMALDTVRAAQKVSELLIAEHQGLMTEMQLGLAYSAAEIERDKLSLQSFGAVSEATAKRVNSVSDMQKNQISAFAAEAQALHLLASARVADIQGEAARAQSAHASVAAELAEKTLAIEAELSFLTAANEDMKSKIAQVGAVSNRYGATTTLLTTAVQDATTRVGQQVTAFSASEATRVDASNVSMQGAIAQARYVVDAAAAAAPIASNLASAALSSAGAFIAKGGR